MLVAAVALSLLAVVGYGLVIRGNNAALAYGRAGIYGMAAAVFAAWIALFYIFIANRFEFEYVTNYSSTDLDLFFTIAASWAGQPGSFLIWIAWTAIVALLLVGRTRHYEPYVLPVVALVIGTLTFFTFWLNPFQPLIDPATGLLQTPAEGRGLNPLLHNFWMIIHPPILFWGFALGTVPFAYAIAAMMRRDYDSWVLRALPWTIAAWVMLGAALLLGGYWAYETLGWGGYWGWDPVENSSLVPWLVLTALVHGMLVQRTSGALRRTNIALALLVFITVFYSTFLTRSGVLENFSVHTFVAEGIYAKMLTFQLVLLFGGFGLLAYRWRDIPHTNLSSKFFSRDNFFALAMLTIMLVAGVVALGTSMPLISGIPGVGHWLQSALGSTFELNDGSQFGGDPLTDGRFAMAVSFYQVTTPPLALVAILLMIGGPLLGWHDTNLRKLLLALRIPAAVAVVATCIALIIGVREPLELSYVGLSIFAIGVNVLLIARSLKGGWLRLGGYFAHIGFAILMLGVVGSSAYASPDERLSFAAGDTVSFDDYTITFNEWQATDAGGGVLNLTVERGGDTFTAMPELYFDEDMGSTIQNPAIKSYIWEDFYIAPADYVPAVNPARPIMSKDEEVEMGPYTIAFREFDLDTTAMMAGENPDVGAVLDVTYQGTTTQVVPRIQGVSDESTGEMVLEAKPAALPGGDSIEMLTMNPTLGMVMLEGTGENVQDLTITPAKAVITVSTKPLVLLVWVGVIITMIGGIMATTRRYLEGNAKLAGVPVRLPKGLKGIKLPLGTRGAAGQ